MSGWTPALKRLGIWVAILVLGGACVTSSPGSARGSLYSVSLRQTGGTRVHFSQFRHQVLMVDFFTTWGPTAVITVPDYSKLYRNHRKKGLAVVGVSLDELGTKVLEPFAQSLEVPYPLVVASKQILEGSSFFGNIWATPMLMIFDRDGELVKIFIGHVPISEIERILLRVLR